MESAQAFQAVPSVPRNNKLANNARIDQIIAQNQRVRAHEFCRLARFPKRVFQVEGIKLQRIRAATDTHFRQPFCYRQPICAHLH